MFVSVVKLLIYDYEVHIHVIFIQASPYYLIFSKSLGLQVWSKKGWVGL